MDFESATRSGSKSSAKLIEHGRAANTPVAVVHRATQAAQEVLIGSLDDIADTVRTAGISSPAAIIVGEVVALHETLTGPLEEKDSVAVPPLALVGV